MAFIRPLYGHYTAFIRPLYGHYTTYTQPVYGLYNTFIRSLYGLNTAFIRPLYGLYTAVISNILICISKGVLEQFQTKFKCLFTSNRLERQIAALMSQ